MTNPVIATWTNDDGSFAEVALPDLVADWHGDKTKWEVPLYHPIVDKILDGNRAGEVTIRQSDGRIGVTSVPNILETADDARRLAAALLAAAEAHDAGVRPRSLREIAEESTSSAPQGDTRVCQEAQPMTTLLAHERVSCPKCGMPVGRRCRTLSSGRGTSTHAQRMRKAYPDQTYHCVILNAAGDTRAALLAKGLTS